MLNNFDRYPLTFGPTPIEKLVNLSAHLGNKVNIFAKREDCNSGLACGGNKIRKLEAESRDHFKQIDDLGNQVARLKRELEEKKVISWEKEKFDKDLDKHIEEITKE